ncbi:MAG: CDP-alcohol phosphatidyltransferase family protein [Acholeplasmatales bacterium]|nr:MAG: CDP-alcohol phosphatidyltransferase family protein [Acholeplasmatales bacterium]
MRRSNESFALTFPSISATLRVSLACARREVDVMRKVLTVPNSLSLSRLVFLPWLYLFLWREQLFLFFVLFTVLGSTDFLDGYLARKWNQVSRLGKALDTVADMFFYISVAYFLYYLYPQAILSNRYFLIAAFAVYGLSFLVPFMLYKKAYTLHTMILRSNAVFVFFMMLLSFMMNTTLLLSIVSVIFIIGFVEEILIFIHFGPVDQDTSSYFAVSLERRLKDWMLDSPLYQKLSSYRKTPSK